MSNSSLEQRFAHLFSKGQLFVFSGPSGCGKSTIINALMKKHPDFVRSISATTRAPRPGEETTSDYMFLSRQDFEQMIAENKFLEYATVYKNLYGTPKEFIQKSLEEGKKVLIDVDTCGVEQIRKQQDIPAVFIYILPESKQVLSDRLKSRNTDAPEVIDLRLEKFDDEIKQIKMYDYVIFNKTLETAIAQVESVIDSQQHRILETQLQ